METGAKYPIAGKKRKRENFGNVCIGDGGVLALEL